MVWVKDKCVFSACILAARFADGLPTTATYGWSAEGKEDEKRDIVRRCGSSDMLRIRISTDLNIVGTGLERHACILKTSTQQQLLALSEQAVCLRKKQKA